MHYYRFTLAMGSSPGFGSTPCDYCALFRLAFATAPGITPLTSPQRVTRRFILQKARGQACPIRDIALPPLVSRRFQVLFHSPHRRSFHLSLTVLVHYRSSRVFSLGKWASRLPTGLACPVVLKVISRSPIPFAYETITLYGGPFQNPSTRNRISHSFGSLWRPRRALQPPSCNGHSLDTRWVWALPLSLATTQGIISFPRGTEMFQFPRFPPTSLYIQLGVPRRYPG